MLTLQQLQTEVEAWQRINFKDKKPYQPLLGIVEEVGELSHAHLKLEQGIRGSKEEHELAKIDAVGDIVVYLADYCTQNHISLQDAVERTWQQVKQRNWTNNARTGISTNSNPTQNKE